MVDKEQKGKQLKGYQSLGVTQSLEDLHFLGRSIARTKTTNDYMKNLLSCLNSLGIYHRNKSCYIFKILFGCYIHKQSHQTALPSIH